MEAKIWMASVSYCSEVALKLPVEYNELLIIITAALKLLRHCQLNEKKYVDIIKPNAWATALE